MWCVVKTLAGILAEMDEDPYVDILIFDNKYKAIDEMRSMFKEAISDCCYAKYNEETLRAKVAYAQSVATIAVKQYTMPENHDEVNGKDTYIG